MSAAVAAATAAASSATAAAALSHQHNRHNRITSTPEIRTSFINYHHEEAPAPAPSSSTLGRYESQKRRDWNNFRQYLRNHRPTLAVSRCSGAHVIEFLRCLDSRFGNTKVHTDDCLLLIQSSSCSCPVRQGWASLDGLIGRLFAAYEEFNGGLLGRNPFGARDVRLYLVEVRDSQAKARGIVKQNPN